MGESTHSEIQGIGRRLRRAVWLSFAGLLPYVVFVAVLSLSPATLGTRPFGGAASLGIYWAVFLFVWPVVVAVLYLRGVEERRRP